MSFSDLSAVGSFVSGLAVLASLIFVGFQLKQNTEAVRAAASQAHSQNWQQITLPVIESADFARIWRLGLEDIGCLTDDECVRFYAFAGAILRFFEGARLQWRHGQLDEEHWHNVEKTAIDFAATAGFKAYWSSRRHWLSPEFQKWYESLSAERAQGLYGKPISQVAAD
jgi:integrase